MRLRPFSAPRALLSPVPSALAWTFAVVAALLIIGLTVGLALFRIQGSTNELIAATQRESRLATRVLASVVAQELVRLGGSPKEAARSLAAPTPEFVGFLDQIVDRLLRESAIVKVKLIDAFGTITYSSQRDEQGTTTSNPAAISAALGGSVTSRISRRDQFRTMTGTLRDVDIVETYLPLSLHGVAVDVVVEIYSDVTPTFDGLRARQGRETRTMAGVALATYLFLLWLVISGGRMLRASEQLAADRAVQANEATRFLHEGIESMTEGIAFWDAEHRLLKFNRRFLEILPHLRGFVRTGMTLREVNENALRADSPGISDSDIERRMAERLAARREPGKVWTHELSIDRIVDIIDHRTAAGGYVTIYRDVTEARRTERRVAESEARFRDFASSTADWFWEMDERLRFTYVSQSNYAITGMRPEEFYQTSPLDFRPDGVTDQDWEQHLQALRAAAPFKDLRFRAVGPDGVTRTVATSGKPFFDAEGRFQGYRGIGTDITPIVEAQRRAEASEALLRDGVEGMASGLVMFDVERRVVLWNSRYLEIFPYLREVIHAGMSARELVTQHAASKEYGLAPEQREAWVRDWLQHGWRDRSEFQQALADGRTLRISGTMSRLGGEIYVVHDATAEIAGQKRLERTLSELRQSQEEVRRLALVARHTDNAVVITDEHGTVEWVNAAFARITGYTLEEVVGRKPGRMLQGPETDPSTVGAMRDAIARGEGFRVEVLNYAKDGRSYWLEIDCSPVRDESGQVERFIAVEADITERKRQERRLAEALERERAAAVQQRRFVAVAAHEFRTPLTIIDGAAQRLMRYAETITPGDLSDRARKIRGAVQRMAQLIDTTLDTARLDEGRIELNLSTVDLVQAVTAICQRGDGFAPDFRFEIASSSPSLPIRADARLIEQVFTNLLSNAVKYSGGSRHVEVALRGGTQDVEVDIRDHGIGVPAAEVDHLFTRFFRASTAKG
ncbi:MAG: PAS domain S-box protein, partial [Alphaproteobacteria bacterium]|nr:PAS domain S-box protein [Alphaproteobacteria bacterium]